MIKKVRFVPQTTLLLTIVLHFKNKKDVVMKRKNFLLTGFALAPAIAFPKLSKPGGLRATAPFKVEAGKSRFNEILTFRKVNSQDIKVSSKDTGNKLTVLEYTGREKTGPPLHIHFEQDEIFYVAEGEYRFVIGDKTIHAKAGDTVFGPRNIKHTWIQLTDYGRQFYMLQPDGTFEDFLRTCQALKKEPTMEELQKIHLDHGMKILGPPLTL
jgi:quercetin 2,3-dioxygenase